MTRKQVKKINLQLFCDTDVYRGWILTTPWMHAGFWYATDGRICVRVPIKPADVKRPFDTAVHRPNAFALFQAFPPCTLAWPSFEHESLACPVCDGSDKTLVECETCAGFGCKKCGGTGATPGKKKCIYCKKGVILSVPKGESYDDSGRRRRRRRRIQISGIWFNTFYLSLIESQCHGIQYAVASTDRPLSFTAHGGVQGLLAGLAD